MILKLIYYGLFTPLAKLLGALRLWGLDLGFRDPAASGYWRPVRGASIPRLPRAVRRRKNRFSPHHYSLYRNTPGYRPPGPGPSHNALGFRGPEISLRKPEGVFRIACIGESTTYCTGIDDNAATYPGRLGHHLRETHGLDHIEVINAGVGGQTSAETLIHYIFKVQPLAPDLLVYMFGHNDGHARRQPLLSRDYSEYCKTWKREDPAKGKSINQLTRTIEETPLRRASNTGHNSGAYFRDNVFSMASLVEAWGGRIAFVLPPYRDINPDGHVSGANPFHRAIWEHREIVRELGRRKHIPCFDLAGAFPPPPRKSSDSSEHFQDAVHFTALGADTAARAVAAFLARDVIAAGLDPCGS